MKDCLSIANIEENINRTFESVLHLNAGVTNYSTRQIVPHLAVGADAVHMGHEGVDVCALDHVVFSSS